MDGEIVRARAVSHPVSVLEFRRAQFYRTGTKEGCAESNCGACTHVLAGRTGEDDPRWRPANAWIRLLRTIDGQVLITVESLKSPNGAHERAAARVERRVGMPA